MAVNIFSEHCCTSKKSLTLEPTWLHHQMQQKSYEPLRGYYMRVPTAVFHCSHTVPIPRGQWGSLQCISEEGYGDRMCPLHCQSYSSLFMRQVCFSMCMVARSVELVRTSRTSSCRSSSVSASRARFFSCISICKHTHTVQYVHTCGDAHARLFK